MKDKKYKQEVYTDLEKPAEPMLSVAVAKSIAVDAWTNGYYFHRTGEEKYDFTHKWWDEQIKLRNQSQNEKNIIIR